MDDKKAGLICIGRINSVKRSDPPLPQPITAAHQPHTVRCTAVDYRNIWLHFTGATTHLNNSNSTTSTATSSRTTSTPHLVLRRNTTVTYDLYKLVFHSSALLRLTGNTSRSVRSPRPISIPLRFDPASKSFNTANMSSMEKSKDKLEGESPFYISSRFNL